MSDAPLLTRHDTGTIIIHGKHVAAHLRAELAGAIAQLKTDHNLVPGLAVIIVGEDPASTVYVRNKHKASVEVGINSIERRLPDTTTQDELLAEIHALNNDPAVHGILVQLPLPAHIDPKTVIDTIDPAKDVDGFHVVNVGRLSAGIPALVPCTPKGCLHLLKLVQPQLAGLHALVIGRSNIVGKPMAQLLLSESCTVTIAHSRTRNLAEECARADIVIAAIGQPQIIDGRWFKKDAIVVDVGINRVMQDDKSKLVGDVDYQSALGRVRAITPVPGGVGPMTIACLLDNTVKAACMANNIPRPVIALQKELIK